MKKLFLIIVMVFVAHVVVANMIYNAVNFSYTPFIQKCCNELGIKGQTIYVQRTNMDLQGFVVKADYGYILFVSNKSENFYATIAHELVHIKQDLHGRWDINNPTTRLKSYSTDYVSKQSREIEKEANKVGRYLAFKYQ